MKFECAVQLMQVAQIFDIRHCLVKVKGTTDLAFTFTTVKTVSSYINFTEVLILIVCSHFLSSGPH